MTARQAPSGAADARGDAGRAAFVEAHTSQLRSELVPEIALRVATEVTPLWHATEAWLAARGVPPPFWAFAWCGGQALARYLLDNPGEVRGRRVLDVACGGGIVAIAAAMAGAHDVEALDIDPFAAAATRANAHANGVTVRASTEDRVGELLAEVDVVTAGDVCYEQPMAQRMLTWFQALAARGVRVLVGDPGRTYAPAAGVRWLAAYDVPVPHELEGRSSRHTDVLDVVAPLAAPRCSSARAVR